MVSRPRRWLRGADWSGPLTILPIVEQRFLDPHLVGDGLTDGPAIQRVLDAAAIPGVYACAHRWSVAPVTAVRLAHWALGDLRDLGLLTDRAWVRWCGWRHARERRRVPAPARRYPTIDELLVGSGPLLDPRPVPAFPQAALPALPRPGVPALDLLEPHPVPLLILLRRRRERAARVEVRNGCGDLCVCPEVNPETLAADAALVRDMRDWSAVLDDAVDEAATPFRRKRSVGMCQLPALLASMGSFHFENGDHMHAQDADSPACACPCHLPVWPFPSADG